MRMFHYIRYHFLNCYDFFRYDLPRFFRNLWMFRKELYEYRPYDYHGTVGMLKRSIVGISTYIERYGQEVEECRNKKVYYMRRSIYLMDLIMKGEYMSLAEERLGYKMIYLPMNLVPETVDGIKINRVEWVGDSDEIRKSNRMLFSEERRIEAETWAELFDILEGRSHVRDSDVDHCTGKGLATWWD